MSEAGLIQVIEPDAIPATPGDLSNPMLKKHVAAVHTSGNLSLVERKLVNILLLNAYDNLPTAKSHSIPVHYLSTMLGWGNSNNTTGLKDALKKIQATVMEFNLMEDGDEVWESMALLGPTRITKGVCTYKYDADLAKKLYDPEVYATINVGVQQRFKGGYALTLYENCVRYRGTSHGSTGWWDIAKFRRLMGAEAPMYDEFKHLSNFVIRKSVEEINEKSDIFLEYKYERLNRKVSAIRFTVTANPQYTLPSMGLLDSAELDQVRETETFKRLREHVSELLALTWMRDNPEQALKAALDYTEDRDRKGLIKASTGAYLRSLVEAGADVGPSAFQQKKRAAKPKDSPEELQEAQQAELAVTYRETKLRAVIKALTPEQLREYGTQFLESEAGSELDPRFDANKGKFADAKTRVAFTSWLRATVEPEFVQADFDAWLLARNGQPA